MVTAAIRQFKPHPAQMRTSYDLEGLAALTLQLYERGLDSWQPLLAAPRGADGETLYIVSGHRRHMAQLLAFTLRDWAKERPETEITVEVVRVMVTTLVESLGSLEKLIASLLGKYGAEEIPYARFTGSEKAEILTLQAANYGGERPDMLGVAHSFRQALLAGATVEEIARNSGQHAHYVRNHLALAEIPGELAARIVAGELPLSVAVAVAELPEPKRSGLTLFILANLAANGGGEAGKVTAGGIKGCAATLQKWPGLQAPLLVKHQSQRNIARALARLWGQVEAAYPEDAYAAAAMFIYRGAHEEPWAAQEKLALWFQALGGETYFVGGKIHWGNVVAYLLEEVSCATCPIGQLPKHALRSDLSQGQGGALGMPCRVGQEAARCIHGLAPNDSFEARVPWTWSGHLGVVHEGGDYRVKSYEDLLAAWQAQAAKEQAEDEAAAREAAAREMAVTPPAAAAQTAAIPPRATAATAATQTRAQPAAMTETPPEATAVPPTPAKESPVAKQRAQIADFMARHEQMTANHPFATPCGQCRHRLEVSPTKDENVPHCAWAGRLRSVTFTVLAAAEKNGPRIPVCRQFAPVQGWRERIPAHPHPPQIPRAWLQEQILHLVGESNRHGSDRNSFEFLTGRPLGGDERYGEWFRQQLAAQGGELSDAQMFTLFIWAHAEWQRAQRQPFSVPVNGMMQFVTVEEKAWRMEDGA